MTTAQHALIDAKLPPGTTLRSVVATGRRSGLGWRAIADEVSDTTGVFVSHTTIRRWFDQSGFDRGMRKPNRKSPRREMLGSVK